MVVRSAGDSGLTVRRLTPADGARLAPLRLAALADAPHAFLSSPEDDMANSPEFVSEMLGDPDQAVFAAVTDGDALAGMAGIYRDRHTKRRHEAHIWGVWVAPEIRSRGVGRGLVVAAIDFARSLAGVTHVVTSATERATEAIALYHSLGFVTWGVEPDVMLVGGELLAEHHMVLALAE